jgi:hypothetical protein
VDKVLAVDCGLLVYLSDLKMGSIALLLPVYRAMACVSHFDARVLVFAFEFVRMLCDERQVGAGFGRGCWIV